MAELKSRTRLMDDHTARTFPELHQKHCQDDGVPLANATQHWQLANSLVYLTIPQPDIACNKQFFKPFCRCFSHGLLLGQSSHFLLSHMLYFCPPLPHLKSPSESQLLGSQVTRPY